MNNFPKPVVKVWDCPPINYNNPGSSSNWNQGQKISKKSKKSARLAKDSQRPSPSSRPLYSTARPPKPRGTPSATSQLSALSHTYRPVVPCLVMNDVRYFIQADYLQHDVIHVLTNSNTYCHLKNGKVHFPKHRYPEVASILLSLDPSIKVYRILEDPVPHPVYNDKPPVPSSSTSVIPEDENWDDCLPLPASTLPKHKSNWDDENWEDDLPERPMSATTSSFSRPRGLQIPGFETIKHLETLSTVPKSFGGNFYTKFVLVLPEIDAPRFYAAKNAQRIILRLVHSKGKACEDLQEDQRNRMRIERIRFNGEAPTFPTTKAGHFSVDVTRCLKGGVRTTIEISTIIDGCLSDDVVVYWISIARMLNSDEMLKDLKAKSPIPISCTRKLVTDSLAEAAENGILTSDSKLLVSLKCPLGKTHMINPCRGVSCDHFACFDALNFLQTYEKAKPSSWICPVCDCHLDYEDLRIDSYFDVIVSSMGEDSKHFNVKIDASGGFSIDSSRAIDADGQATKTIALVDDDDDDTLDILSLSSDDENDKTAIVQPRHSNKRNIEEVTLDSTDSSGDEDFRDRPIRESAPSEIYQIEGGCELPIKSERSKTYKKERT